MKAFALINEEQHVYAVNVIDWPERRRPAGVVVIARIEGDKVIIDRPLVDALVENGVPREQIILAYAGETVPDAAQG